METTEDDYRNSVLSQLVDSVKAISELSECCNALKKVCGNLVRRVKLLSPLFEELRDSDEALGGEEIKAFESLRVALGSTKELLKSVNQGSKLYQVLVSFLCSLVFCLVCGLRKERKGKFGFCRINYVIWDDLSEGYRCIFLYFLFPTFSKQPNNTLFDSPKKIKNK